MYMVEDNGLITRYAIENPQPGMLNDRFMVDDGDYYAVASPGVVSPFIGVRLVKVSERFRPIASFTHNPETGKAPLRVSFVNTSYYE